jgi:hypothetical protein
MKRVSKFLIQLFPKTSKIPLGRWNYVKSKKQLDQRIDLSNEDHCGSCGQYALSKSNVFRLPDALKKNRNLSVIITVIFLI